MNIFRSILLFKEKKLMPNSLLLIYINIAPSIISRWDFIGKLKKKDHMGELYIPEDGFWCERSSVLSHASAAKFALELPLQNHFAVFLFAVPNSVIYKKFLPTLIWFLMFQGHTHSRERERRKTWYEK